MCLICEEEDLYFLYLERLERARKEARGERAAANAGWLWATQPAASAQPATPVVAAAAKPRFACDAPE